MAKEARNNYPLYGCFVLSESAKGMIAAMERYAVSTPEGTRDRLFPECRDMRSAQGAITALFESRGYREVLTPGVEYYDMILRSGSPLPEELMLKIIDRTGKILVMRPDCTAPVARIAATKLKSSDFPQRFYYNQTIYRSEGEHMGNDSEIFQCGIELMGVSGVRGDIEAIATAVDAIRSCGIERFHIELGHSGFFRTLAAGLEAGDGIVERVRLCIEAKNFAQLRGLLEPYGDNEAARALRRMAFLFGGDEVLKEAKELTKRSEALAAVEYLEEINSELFAAGYADRIRFDLGLVNMIDYYTGVVFRGYIEGAGSAVLSGGRYDNLTGFFGKSLPATGFAMNVGAISRFMAQEKTPGVRAVVHYEKGCLKRAIEIIENSEKGELELSGFDRLSDSIALAAEKGIPSVIVVGGDGESEVTL